MKKYERHQMAILKTMIKKALFLIGILCFILCVIHLVNRVKILENQIEKLSIEQVFAQAKTDEEIFDNTTITPEVQTSEVQTSEVQTSETQTSETESTTQAQPEETSVEEENSKIVYLTFDDGPSSNTNAILDILKEYNVKATFFVNGKTDEISKEGYKRIVEEGHTLAMHSYTHVYKEVYASKEAFLEDVYRLQNYLFDLTGTKPIYYRFPGGSSNTISEMDMQIFIQALHEEGMEYFDWNVANGDGGNKELTTDQILTNVWNDIPKYEHSMILMHDSVQKGFTVEALPEMIKQLQEAGYTILPIDDTTPLIQHIRDNSIENNSQ
ncbi:MAG: polysaccharide deacetylase [Lachnospiraceae bacterium]|nr:polysaccharide deacetylase [Lachnospiraceae bacterium]